MTLPRFITKSTPGYELYEFKEWIKKGKVELYLKKEDPETRYCCRCDHKLEKAKVGEHKLVIRGLDAMAFKVFIHYKRQKHYCSNCKKNRSEKIDFLSKESPTMTAEYSWWLGKMFEFSPVSRVYR